MLVAGGELTRRAPELVRRFVAVTQQAWAQCLAQPAPCVDALLAEHPQLDGAREQAVWELVAQSYRLDPAPPQTLGAFDPARVAGTLAELDAAFGTQTNAGSGTDNAFLDLRIRALR